MFVLSTLSDSHVRVLPENLGKPRVEALSDAIEQIYVDKVHGAPLVYCEMAASGRMLHPVASWLRWRLRGWNVVFNNQPTSQHAALFPAWSGVRPRVWDVRA